jgi:hypothetical protein
VTGTADAPAGAAAEAAGAELSRATPTQKVPTPALINATNKIHRFQRNTLLRRILIVDRIAIAEMPLRGVGETHEVIVGGVLSGLDGLAIAGVTDR